MHARGALVRVGHGRYAIPVLGASTSRAEVGWRGQLHARLEPYGPYYLGFGSALEDHHLTDRAEPVATVGIGFRSPALARASVTVVDRTIIAISVSARRQSFGIELVRLSRDERYRRSDLERTLLDCVLRPDLAGGLDAALLAWGRAFASSTVDSDRLVAHALKLGADAVKRAGVLLAIVDPEAGDALLTAAPRSTRRMDRIIAIDPRRGCSDAPLDETWPVAYNVPRTTIEGWLGYGK